MIKIALVVIAGLLGGYYAGAAHMQKTIADQFGAGEGRAICEAILGG